MRLSVRIGILVGIVATLVIGAIEHTQAQPTSWEQCIERNIECH